MMEFYKSYLFKDKFIVVVVGGLFLENVFEILKFFRDKFYVFVIG